MRRNVVSLWTVLLAVILSSTSLAAAETDWKVGTGRAVITPEQSMWMAGYASRDRPAEGKLTDLWAKALMLQDADGNRGVLITLDIVGISRDLSVAICDELMQRYGLDRSEIALCTSHTHSGPVIGHNLETMHRAIVPPRQQQLIDQYAVKLKDDIVRIVGQAIADAKPCSLHHGTGVATFATNRRNNNRSKIPTLRAEQQLVGPNDHDVPVLAVRDAEDNLAAIVFGYACHATVLSGMDWSGDYPGEAQIELERLYPGTQAMFWTGCGADQNPEPRRTDELAKHYGRRLAVAVESVLLTEAMQQVPATLRTIYVEIPLELDTLPTREELQQVLKDGNQYQQSRAKLLLAQIDGGTPLPATYPYPIGTWTLGNDVRWVILGGEVVVDYALRMKSELQGTVWVAGYANDVMAYIPSRRVLREGGYEGATSMIYYGLPTTWAPTIENAIVGEVKKQLKSTP